jgi:hypothetical protein
MRLISCVAVLMMAANALAQNQNQGAPSFNGTIVSFDKTKGTFSVVDKNGAVVSMTVTGNTSYQENKAEVNPMQVVRFGMDVRGTYAPDGTVEQVTARGITSQLNVAQMQAFLGAGNEEWSVLKPKIEKVQALRKIAESRATNATQNGNNGNGNGNGSGNANKPPPPRNPVQELQQNLNKAFFDQAMSPAQLKNSLDYLRDTQARARADLTQARKDLTDLITPRQEVLLVLMGVLE